MAHTEPFKVDGVTYSREEIEELLRVLIRLRDEAAENWRLHTVGVYSHVIGALAYLNELPRPEECTDCGD